jgi:hypothetical protein
MSDRLKMLEQLEADARKLARIEVPDMPEAVLPANLATKQPALRLWVTGGFIGVSCADVPSYNPTEAQKATTAPWIVRGKECRLFGFLKLPGPEAIKAEPGWWTVQGLDWLKNGTHAAQEAVRPTLENAVNRWAASPEGRAMLLAGARRDTVDRLHSYAEDVVRAFEDARNGLGQPGTGSGWREDRARTVVALLAVAEAIEAKAQADDKEA